MNTAVEGIGQADELLAGVLAGVNYTLLGDEDTVELLSALEQAGRRLDAARALVATEVGTRSRYELGHDSLAWKLGARNSVDLISRVTLVSGREVNRRLKLGAKVAGRMMATMPLPPLYPTVARALTSGELGVDAAEAILTALCQIEARCAPDDLHTAERALVAAATGTVTEETEGLAGEGLAFSADLVRGIALEWQARLDPDGVAPSEEVLAAKSNIGFGQFRSGLYPLRGGVTPELRGILDTVFDTYLSAGSHPAGSTPAFPSTAEQQEEQERIEAGELIPGAEELADERTGGEKRADILRGIFTAAGADPGTPTMGGAAPVVSIHVNAKDLDAGHGVGWVDGVEAPVSLAVVERAIDAGGYRPIVFGTNGAVLHMGNTTRFFTPTQRKALAARDGGCIIPGCRIPARYTQVHHLIRWSDGGKTDIDNGVLLCWSEHARIEREGWKIRMVNGKPQVKAPIWIDPAQQWRPANSHRATRAITQK